MLLTTLLLFHLLTHESLLGQTAAVHAATAVGEFLLTPLMGDTVQVYDARIVVVNSLLLRSFQTHISVKSKWSGK